MFGLKSDGSCRNLKNLLEFSQLFVAGEIKKNLENSIIICKYLCFYSYFSLSEQRESEREYTTNFGLNSVFCSRPQLTNKCVCSGLCFAENRILFVEQLRGSYLRPTGCINPSTH